MQIAFVHPKSTFGVLTELCEPPAKVDRSFVPMLASEFTIRDDFPPVDYDEWRAIVEADLNGAPFEKKLVTHTYEGIDIQPLYVRKPTSRRTRSAWFPRSAAICARSQRAWHRDEGADLRQEHAHPDLAVTNRAILADLADGRRRCNCGSTRPPATAWTPMMLPRRPRRVRRHHGLQCRRFGCSAGRCGFSRCRNSTRCRSRVSAGGIAVGGTLQAAGSLVTSSSRSVQRRPAGESWLADGELPVSTDAAMTMLADLAKWTSLNCPHMTAVGVDTAPYHHAGATAAQDLAFGLATAVAYLRAMTDAGLDFDTAARQILFRFSLGTHHFLAIAKLRAARRLWWRVVEACGGSDAAGAQRIHARTSNRVLTQRDPYLNILRNTTGVFAAVVGGAEVVTSVPLNQVSGLPDEFSRRIARNTLLILQEEGHLHRVIDPAGGSWFLDTITEQLAEAAWIIFQEIERRGGMLAVLESGWVNQQIDSAFAPRASDIARRKEGITGVSEFPNLAEERLVHERPDVDAFAKGCREQGEACPGR